MILSEIIQSLNEFVFPRQLRRYQAVIAGGGITVIDGYEIKFLASWMARNGHIIYICSCNESTIAMITHRVRDGYPIVQCMDYLGREIRWTDGKKSTDSTTLILKTELRIHQNGIRDFIKLDKLNIRPVLLVGHNNFAHFLWNQLGAIIQLIRAGNYSCLDYFQISTPLGRLEDMLPLHHEKRLRELTRLGYRKIDPGVIFYRAGGTRVDTTAIEAVYNRAVKYLEQSSVSHERYLDFKQKSKDRVRIWISVRHDKRTCINFNDFLHGVLLPEIIHITDRIVLVIDGFSTQFDFSTENPGFVERLHKNDETIRAFIASCESQGIKAFNLNGLSMYESIVYAREMDLYISHVGTLQHKVAWFSLAEGIVHMPPSRKWERQTKWLTDMVENGKAPQVLATSDSCSDFETVTNGKDSNYYIEISETNRRVIKDAINRALIDRNIAALQ